MWMLTEVFSKEILSPLIFVICMIPPSLLLRKMSASCNWGRKEFKINHLLFFMTLSFLGKMKTRLTVWYKQLSCLVRI